MPETGKRRRSCQNENRNVIPNIVHKLFSYMLKNIKSGKLVKEIMQKLFDTIPEYRDDVFDFVDIIRKDSMDTLGRHLEFEFKQ